MNQRKLHRFCMLLLAFSICVRALCAMGVEARAEQALRASNRTPLVLSWLLPRADEPAETGDVQKVWVVQLAGGDAAQTESAAAMQTQPVLPDKPAQQQPIEQQPDKPALTFSDEEAAAMRTCARERLRRDVLG